MTRAGQAVELIVLVDPVLRDAGDALGVGGASSLGVQRVSVAAQGGGVEEDSLRSWSVVICGDCPARLPVCPSPQSQCESVAGS